MITKYFKQQKRKTKILHVVNNQSCSLYLWLALKQIQQMQISTNHNYSSLKAKGLVF